MINIEIVMFIDESTLNENCVIDNQDKNNFSKRVYNDSRFAATFNTILRYFKKPKADFIPSLTTSYFS